MEKNNSPQKPIIGFTLGDINGIGCELILKACNDPLILELFIPVVYGSSKVLNYYKKMFPQITVNIQSVKEIPTYNTKNINIINCWEEQLVINPGELNMEIGKYAALSLTTASKDLKNGKINALVTAPIHKKNILSSNFNFVGHTPFFKHFFEVDDVVMLMISENMKVALLTEHYAIKEVASQISVSKIINKLQILNKSLQEDFLISRPRIAVLGLNPHNGDDGVIGNEESKMIVPAIAQAQNQQIFAFGPYSADAFFAHQKHLQFDAVLAMYHDQGLIPFKSLSIGEGVNYTAGLNAVRTSPDHGTAFDIAGKNLAEVGSFIKAIFDAIDIYKNKQMYLENTKNPLKRQSQTTHYSNEDDNKRIEIIKDILP